MTHQSQISTQIGGSSVAGNVFGLIREALSRYLEVQARMDSYH